jgi:hypothetical protein
LVKKTVNKGKGHIKKDKPQSKKTKKPQTTRKEKPVTRQTKKPQTAKKEKRQTQKKDLPKPKSKTLKWILPIVIIIVIIGIVWLLLTPDVAADEPKAQLVIDYGTVQVKHDSGSWTSAENGMDLYQSDSIRTGDNSSASIILFETSIVRLDSNTKVTLEEIIREEGTSVTLQQDSGRTWNTISKISGIDNYDVQTPTTVASVRGTAFVVIVDENGSTYYGVSHGILNVSSISNGVIQDSIDVSGNESVFVFIDLINESLEVIPFEMDDWVLENLLKDEQFVEDLKAELYARIEEYIPELKAEYGINDEEIDILLEGYILGYIDVPEDSPEWVKELFEL